MSAVKSFYAHDNSAVGCKWDILCASGGLMFWTMGTVCRVVGMGCSPLQMASNIKASFPNVGLSHKTWDKVVHEEIPEAVGDQREHQRRMHCPERQ
eukprot:333264-Amphidinium_carterae.1